MKALERDRRCVSMFMRAIETQFRCDRAGDRAEDGGAA